MGKNKKTKKSNETKTMKNEIREEVKNEKVVVEENVKTTVKKDNKKEQKAIDKENKRIEKEKSKEEKKKEKIEKKEAKKEQLDKNEIEKALVKKAKKASNNDTKIIIGIVLAVLIIAFGIFGFYFYKLNAESVAKYDGGKVSVSDYEVYYKTFAPMLEYYGYPASIIPEQIANKAALDQIIVEMAKAAGVEISDEDRASVEEVFNDQEQLTAFREQGIDIGRMKKLYLNDYLISTYIEKLSNEAKDEDVLEYIKSMNSENKDLDLNEYNTSHILFTTTDAEGNDLSEDEKNSKRQKAQAALDRVKNGEDFATVAKELSEDTGTKEDGGKYTMYVDGNTVEQYEAAVKTLADGEIYATLVETDYGYHIIKLDSKVKNGRAKNKTERDEYVDSKINALAEEKNLEIDTEALNKLIEKITGTSIEDEDTTTDETTSIDEETITDETQNTEETNSTETQAE